MASLRALIIVSPRGCAWRLPPQGTGCVQRRAGYKRRPPRGRAAGGSGRSAGRGFATAMPRGPAPGLRAMRSRTRRSPGNPGSPCWIPISRKILLVFCFERRLGPDTGKQLPKAAECPGPQRNRSQPQRLGPTREGSNPMTEPAAPCGTTSTRRPSSANGPGPPPAPRRAQLHSRSSGMRTGLIAGLPALAWTRQPESPPGRARPSARGAARGHEQIG